MSWTGSMTRYIITCVCCVLLGKLDLSVWKFPSLYSSWSPGSPRELLKVFHFTGTFYLGHWCCMSSRCATTLLPFAATKNGN